MCIFTILPQFSSVRTAQWNARYRESHSLEELCSLSLHTSRHISRYCPSVRVMILAICPSVCVILPFEGLSLRVDLQCPSFNPFISIAPTTSTHANILHTLADTYTHRHTHTYTHTYTHTLSHTLSFPLSLSHSHLRVCSREISGNNVHFP